MKSTLEIQLGGDTVTLETGAIARQANGAVVVRHGSTFILGTATCDLQAPSQDFFPLTVDYREKMASRGRIPGNFFRRETRASELETLTSRLIDRSLRPLFPSKFQKETVVTVTVYSADDESELSTLSLLAASAALMVSDIPFNGPMIGGTILSSGGRTMFSVRQSNQTAHEFDLVASFTPDGLVMLEGGSLQGTESQFIETLVQAASQIRDPFKRLVDWQEKVGKTKLDTADVDQDLKSQTAYVDVFDERLNELLLVTDKKARQRGLTALLAEVAIRFPDAEDQARSSVAKAFKERTRAQIMSGRRADGRTHDEVRPIECIAGLLQNNHGSALFTRGETQALVSATLGSQREAQDIETLDGMLKRPFILHYNFPGFSVGETRRPSGPGRREIGHGSLARRALLAVMPETSQWPYTTRVVSDITESNGSSSMATVCGGCLALLDAGVPLLAPVAGIAMGLITGAEQSAILSDILGEEDHLGDMDFKVAGTRKGITAVQLDNKLGALSIDLLTRALEQARLGRLHILDCMSEAIESSAGKRYEQQGRHQSFKIAVSKIGSVVGQGGKTIQGLQADTNTKIEIGKDGHVLILGQKAEEVRRAREKIDILTTDLRIDRNYEAQIVSLKDFGVFVRIGSHEGLVHISELVRGNDLSTYTVGDGLSIRVLGADQRGRLKLSERAASRNELPTPTSRS
ncbi:MAG: polyribonucleotide nucleotidyltransferase [Bradymonadia bacterium]